MEEQKEKAVLQSKLEERLITKNISCECGCAKHQKTGNQLAIIECKTSQEKKAAITAISELLRMSEQQLVRLIFELGLESVKSAIVLKCLNFRTPVKAD